MFKATILAIGFAVATAYERDLQGTLVTNGGYNITTTCVRGTSETCTAYPDYCCAAVTKNGAAVTTTTAGTCVPASFHTQTFNVSGTVWGFNCAVAATVSAQAATLTACSDAAPCANNETQCCAPRNWTMNGNLGSKAVTSYCIAKSNAGIQYWANWNIAAQGSLVATGQVAAECPVIVVPVTNTTTTDDGSFAAAIKVTGLMVFALIAGMFF